MENNITHTSKHSELLSLIKHHSSLAGRTQNNFLATLGFVPSVELQQALLEESLKECSISWGASTVLSPLEAALNSMGYVKIVEKETIKCAGKKKVEKEEAGENLAWNT